MAGSSGNATEISIHAPRVGSDRQLFWSKIVIGISIHAPRVGSDFLCDS